MATLESHDMLVCGDCLLGSAGYSDKEAGRPMPTVPIDVHPACCCDEDDGCEPFSVMACDGWLAGWGCTDGDLSGDRHRVTRLIETTEA